MAARDLTAGPVPKHLVSLWIPMLVAMTLQSVYAFVNLVFVTGLGDRAVSGLVITIQAFFIILAIGQVVAQTALAEIAQAYGKNQIGAARSALTTYSLVALVIGVAASFLAWWGAEPYIALFTDDPEVYREGVAYFVATAPTFLLQLMIIVFATAARGSGDFVTPMRIMVMSVVLNAALDPILMFALDMGIAGAGWATVIAQTVACLVYLWRLRARPDDTRSLAGGRPRFTREVFARLGPRGVPAGIQFFLIFVLLGVVLRGMKPFGPDWTGAAGAGFRVMQQTWLPLITLASAAAAMAGQNFGARQLDRVAATGRTALRWGLYYGGAATVVVIVAAPLLARLAASGEGQLGNTVVYFHWSAAMLIAAGITYIPAFMLQAMGRSFFPMLAAGLRVAIVAIVTLGLAPANGWGPEVIFAVTTATAFLEGGLGLLILRRFLRSQPRPASAAVAAPNDAVANEF